MKITKRKIMLVDALNRTVCKKYKTKQNRRNTGCMRQTCSAQSQVSLYMYIIIKSNNKSKYIIIIISSSICIRID